MTEMETPFLLPSVLETETLIQAFDDQDANLYRQLFESADRTHLGALIAYASLAMRELAVRDDVPLAVIRQRIRAQVASAAYLTNVKREDT